MATPTQKNIYTQVIHFMYNITHIKYRESAISCSLFLFCLFVVWAVPDDALLFSFFLSPPLVRYILFGEIAIPGIDPFLHTEFFCS